MARYSIVHSTRQRYRENVNRSRNEVRLQPIDSDTQRLLNLDVLVTPNAEIASSIDYFSNTVWMIAVEAPHRELVLEFSSEVEVVAPHYEPILDHPWDEDSIAFHPASEYLAPSPRVPRLKMTEQLFGEVDLRPRDPDSLMALNRDLRRHFNYVPGSTTVGTNLPEVLERRVGVCQDFAHVFLALARQAGWPARYVSGYLLPGVEEGIAESHAWVEVATPDGRWIGLDPTHGLAVTDGHVRVAVGRDYGDVSPVRGIFAGQLPGEPPEVEVKIRQLAAFAAGRDVVMEYALADQ
ncbi:MAG: transglutaminase family protein [Candidatus Dormibacteria bacterium]